MTTNKDALKALDQLIEGRVDHTFTPRKAAVIRDLINDLQVELQSLKELRKFQLSALHLIKNEYDIVHNQLEKTHAELVDCQEEIATLKSFRISR